MKTKRIAAALLGVLTAVSLCACGNSGSIDDYLQNNDIHLDSSSTDVQEPPVKPENTSSADVSGSDVTTTTTTTTTTAATAAPVNNTLPERFVGSWSVISIYQEAIASDIDIDEALRREQANGISFGTSFFERSGESIYDAHFVVNTSATFEDMERMGISTDPLAGPYGSDAKITSVEIQTADGMSCTTVFLINDTTLIAFGSGMNVYTYEQMTAVG